MSDNQSDNQLPTQQQNPSYAANKSNLWPVVLSQLKTGLAVRHDKVMKEFNAHPVVDRLFQSCSTERGWPGTLVILEAAKSVLLPTLADIFVDVMHDKIVESVKQAMKEKAPVEPVKQDTEQVKLQPATQLETRTYPAYGTFWEKLFPGTKVDMHRMYDAILHNGAMVFNKDASYIIDKDNRVVFFKAKEATNPAVQTQLKQEPLPSTANTPVDKVLDERGKQYGSFADNAFVSQELDRVIREAYSKRSARDLPQLANHQREALRVICQKISRIVTGNPDYHDNWVDIAGYAELGRNPR